MGVKLPVRAERCIVVHNDVVGTAPPGWPSELKSKSKLTRPEVKRRFPDGTAVRVGGIKGVPPLHGVVMGFSHPDYRIVRCAVMTSAPLRRAAQDVSTLVFPLSISGWSKGL